MHSNGHLGVDTLISRVKPRFQLALYCISQIIIVVLMGILVKGSIAMVTLNVGSYTAALGISYSILYFSGIITGVAIAILATRNIVHAVKNKDKISEIVTMQTSDDDEIAANAMENMENLSDEEYAKRLREQGEE